LQKDESECQAGDFLMQLAAKLELTMLSLPLKSIFGLFVWPDVEFAFLLLSFRYIMLFIAIAAF